MGVCSIHKLLVGLRKDRPVLYCINCYSLLQLLYYHIIKYTYFVCFVHFTIPILVVMLPTTTPKERIRVESCHVMSCHKVMRMDKKKMTEMIRFYEERQQQQQQ